jgi:hypothetical protein
MATETDGQKELFPNTPQGNAQRWQMEFKAAQKELEKWHKQGEKIEKRYLDERSGSQENETRWNLFSANVNTVKAMLYGKTPAVSVSRKFSDTDDDVARVAGEMAERILNEDIQKPTDGYAPAIQHALMDFLLPGLGNVRCRYVMEEEMGEEKAALMGTHPETGEAIELAPVVPAVPQKSSEEVETLYVHWKDQLWSPARVFEEVRWWAFQAQMSREELEKRFGKDVARNVPLNAKRGGVSDDLDSRKADPWGRANVWEVWSKEDERVYWVVEGHSRTLDEKKDPLGLEGFWPFPRPMAANLTNSKMVPCPEFVLAQDLYDEIDTLSTRIRLLVDAVAVKGVYDSTASGVAKLLTGGAANTLIPVDNWGMLAEKGGLRGVIDWFPLEAVVAAADKLREYRAELQTTLYQVTGMSDIVRGQAQSSATATEQSIKAKFASVRLQSLQDEFARFASEVQAIRAEIIAKHFDAQTIVERSNVLQTSDAQLAPQAVALLKDEHACYRIQVKPEAISLTDYAALKSERTEVLAAVGGFLQMAAPVAQFAPQIAPFMLKMLQWVVAGIKGASEIESVLDQAVSQATQAAQQPPPPPQPPPPDPKLQAIQLKGQLDTQHKQMDLQHDLMRIQANTQSDAQKQAAQAHYNILESDAKLRSQAVAEVASVTGQGGAP